MTGNVCASPQEDWPSSPAPPPAPGLQWTLVVSEAQVVPQMSPSPRVADPGVLFTGRRAEGIIYKSMNSQPREGSSSMCRRHGVQTREVNFSAHPIRSTKCTPAESEVECGSLEIAPCCRYTRGRAL